MRKYDNGENENAKRNYGGRHYRRAFREDVAV